MVAGTAVGTVADTAVGIAGTVMGNAVDNKVADTLLHIVGRHGWSSSSRGLRGIRRCRNGCCFSNPKSHKRSPKKSAKESSFFANPV